MLKQRRVIVTGGARGLGADIAAGFIEAGMRVTTMDLREAEGQATADRWGDACRFMRCDVSVKEEVDDSFKRAAEWMGGVDVLAAVAGLDRPGHRAEDIPLQTWEEIMGVNARGTFLTNQAAFHLMKDQGGRIINFTSHAGIRGHRERAAYSAAKGAVLGWTRAAAQAWGEQGVTVNAVAPQMRTAAAERHLAKLSHAERAAFDARLRATVPMGGELGEPWRDLLPLMLFLAGDGARFMTGQVFAVDGGMTMLGS